MLDFLRVSVSNSTIQCVMDKKEGIYKRSKRLLNFSPFDESMKKLLLEKQKLVYDIMQRRDDDDLPSSERVNTSSTSSSTSTTNNIIYSGDTSDKNRSSDDTVDLSIDTISQNKTS